MISSSLLKAGKIRYQHTQHGSVKSLEESHQRNRYVQSLVISVRRLTPSEQHLNADSYIFFTLEHWWMEHLPTRPPPWTASVDFTEAPQDFDEYKVPPLQIDTIEYYEQWILLIEVSIS